MTRPPASDALPGEAPPSCSASPHRRVGGPEPENDLLANVDAGGLRPALRAALRRTENALVTPADAHPVVRAAAEHVRTAGGARIRPMLTLLAAHFGHPEADEVHHSATIVELIHMASLCHDDVIDRATRRRGVATVNRRWGDKVAVLVGDYFLARAGMLAAQLGTEQVELTVATVQRMIASQLKETTGDWPRADRLARYVEVIDGKTASLMATSARLGALAGRAPGAVVSAVTRVGRELGIAFQIRDDILDVTAGLSATGKDSGLDLSNGVMSLPILYALTEPGPHAVRLTRLITGGEPDDSIRQEEALTLVRATGVAPAQARLRAHVEAAQSIIAGLPPVPATRVLSSVATHLARPPAG